MTHIALKNVTADFPIYTSTSRSWKKSVLDFSTGGRVIGNEQKYLIVRALENIDFRIEDGERVGLIGHNGAGKSTMLRVLNGVYAPTSGELEIVGTRRSLIDINLGIDSESTGRQNIILRSAMMGVSGKDARDAMESIIEFSGLGDYIDMPLRTYSSGMQLRLAFAVSTHFVAEILLMDEWLSVGDQEFAAKSEARLREFVDKSKILVIASHSPEFLRAICTRVIWLDHGKVRMDGAPDDVLKACFGR